MTETSVLARSWFRHLVEFFWLQARCEFAVAVLISHNTGGVLCRYRSHKRENVYKDRYFQNRDTVMLGLNTNTTFNYLASVS